MRYKYYKKHSRFGLAWSRPLPDRGLSRPTSVFCTTIDICKNFIQLRFGSTRAKNLFLSENSTAKPMLWPGRQKCISHFTILPASPYAVEFCEIRLRSTHRHNHVCQIFSQSVQGLQSSDTPKLPFPIDMIDFLCRPYNSVIM